MPTLGRRDFASRAGRCSCRSPLPAQEASALVRLTEGGSATLPPATLLALVLSQVFHLVAVNDDHLLSASREVIEWPLGEATLRILRDGRGRFFRPVEIADRSGTLLVAGAWTFSRQRAALELIERVTGTL